MAMLMGLVHLPHRKLCIIHGGPTHQIKGILLPGPATVSLPVDHNHYIESMLRILREYGANRKSNEWVSVFSLWDIVFCFPRSFYPFKACQQPFAFVCFRVREGGAWSLWCYSLSIYVYIYMYSSQDTYCFVIVSALFLILVAFLGGWGKKGLDIGRVLEEGRKEEGSAALRTGNGSYFKHIIMPPITIIERQRALQVG